MKVVAVIPAAGSGKRIGTSLPKQFLKFNGKEIIAYSIEKFNSCSDVDEIIIAAMPEHFVRLSKIIRKYGYRKAGTIVEGGATRQESVHNALKVSGCSANDIVLVHDAVRPFVTSKLIRLTVGHVLKFKCCIPVLPVVETVKRISRSGYIEETIDRSLLASAQTPQGFRFGILKSAFEYADATGYKGTDEASIAENAGYKIKTFPGERTNIKITLKEDIKSLKAK